MFKLPFSFMVTGIVSFVLYHVLTLLDFAGWIAICATEAILGIMLFSWNVGRYPRFPEFGMCKCR